MPIRGPARIRRAAGRRSDAGVHQGAPRAGRAASPSPDDGRGHRGSGADRHRAGGLQRTSHQAPHGTWPDVRANGRFGTSRRARRAQRRPSGGTGPAAPPASPRRRRRRRHPARQRHPPARRRRRRRHPPGSASRHIHDAGADAAPGPATPPATSTTPALPAPSGRPTVRRYASGRTAAGGAPASSPGAPGGPLTAPSAPRSGSCRRTAGWRPRIGRRGSPSSTAARKADSGSVCSST